MIDSVQCSTDSTVNQRVSVAVSALFTLVIQLQQVLGSKCNSQDG